MIYVVSAGTKSKSLLKTVKISLPVEPVKGYSVTIPMDNWNCKPQIPVIDEQKHAAVCPLSNSLEWLERLNLLVIIKYLLRNV